ncbi:MAG: MBL fold metallo-hydrolase [Candidatus Methanofastidiosia archaeon]
MQITDKIFLIEGKNNSQFPYSNSLFIKDEKTCLVDTGFGNFIEGVDIIINTHSHPDHIWGNSKFKRIFIHEAESYALNSLSGMKENFGILNSEIEEDWGFFLKSFISHFKSPSQTFKDRDIIELGDLKFEVIHTPGHSPGHCCFYERGERFCYLADIDLSSFGPWYGYEHSNLDDFIKSIEKLKRFKIETAATSHKRDLVEENVSEELKKYLERIQKREERIEEFLREERTLEELTDEKIIYGEFPNPRKIFRYFEKMMITKHLERLRDRGLIEKTERGYVRT